MLSASTSTSLTSLSRYLLVCAVVRIGDLFVRATTGANPAVRI